MTDADRKPLAKILGVLGSTFNEPLDDLKIEGYFLALKDLAFEDVRTAAFDALKTCKFFPRPADIRERIGGENLEALLTTAWAHVLSEIRRVGSWRTPELPADTEAAIKHLHGSWNNAVVVIGRANPFDLRQCERDFKSVLTVEIRRNAPALPPYSPNGRLSA